MLLRRLGVVLALERRVVATLRPPVAVGVVVTTAPVAGLLR
jgi:hypothetical protein